MKKTLKLTEQELNNIVRKTTREIINESKYNPYGKNLVAQYIDSFGNYIDSFEDRNEWDEEIKQKYGEDFFFKLDGELFNAVYDTIEKIAEKYKNY